MATTTEARRKIRTTARHIAHISKDAGPLTLAQLHADLGRAIADLATANYQANKSVVVEAVAAALAAGANHQEAQTRIEAALAEQADKADK